MFAVAGVSGNTGSVVASTLLDQGHKVRVIVRDAAKGEQWKARGAEVAIANLDDSGALTRALTGVSGAYLLVPPDATSADPHGRAKRFVNSIRSAVAESGVKHVVFLSSIGAQQASGTGPIIAVHWGEEALKQTPAAYTFIRASYFMENTANMLYPMKEQGVLPSFFNPASKVPMVATADIGRTAAQALVDGPNAAYAIELSGPEDISLQDVAAAWSAVLGKAVTTVAVPEAGIVPALTQVGISQQVADLYREMSVGIDSGVVTYEGGAHTRRVNGKVTIAEFTRQALAG